VSSDPAPALQAEQASDGGSVDVALFARRKRLPVMRMRARRPMSGALPIRRRRPDPSLLALGPNSSSATLQPPVLVEDYDEEWWSRYDPPCPHCGRHRLSPVSSPSPSASASSHHNTSARPKRDWFARTKMVVSHLIFVASSYTRIRQLFFPALPAAASGAASSHASRTALLATLSHSTSVVRRALQTAWRPLVLAARLFWVHTAWPSLQWMRVVLGVLVVQTLRVTARVISAWGRWVGRVVLPALRSAYHSLLRRLSLLLLAGGGLVQAIPNGRALLPTASTTSRLGSVVLVLTQRWLSAYAQAFKALCEVLLQLSTDPRQALRTLQTGALQMYVRPHTWLCFRFVLHFFFCSSFMCVALNARQIAAALHALSACAFGVCHGSAIAVSHAPPHPPLAGPSASLPLALARARRLSSAPQQQHRSVFLLVLHF
jgi:hypothetical protein